MLLAGKNALLTGAARGIGAATLAALAAEGANVWALARTQSEQRMQRLKSSRTSGCEASTGRLG